MGSTMASKINVTPKGAYLPISKLHSILVVVNLLAHNNISQICYNFSDNLTPLEVIFILLVMVHCSFFLAFKVFFMVLFYI